MSMFVSTSPSYLMLLSLDVCNAYLAGKIRSDLERIWQRAAALKKRLSEKYVFLDGDPLHLTIDAAASKLDGLDLLLAWNGRTACQNMQTGKRLYYYYRLIMCRKNWMFWKLRCI